MKLPILPACACRHRLRRNGDSYFCAHPRVHARGDLVTAMICKLCEQRKSPPPAEQRRSPPPFVRPNGSCLHQGEPIQIDARGSNGDLENERVLACGHLLHETTTARRCANCPDFEPVLSVGQVRSWAVGITTAPRREPTLERCLASLAVAGWDRPRIFAEPDGTIPEACSNLPCTRRTVTLGAWPNWYLGLAELVMIQPEADAYVMCQDDVVFCRGVRAYLERKLWPVERVGVVSLFCPLHYAQRRPDGFWREDHGWNTWGALAYVLPNASARALLAHPRVVDHRARGRAEGKKNVDSLVGSWCRQSGLPYYVHRPSLAQHIGDTSTLYPQSTNSGRRRATRFAGERTDVSEVLA